MAYVCHRAAVHIIDWFHRAEEDLKGVPVVTFNGEAGTVKDLKLDEAHGLCFTMDDPPSALDPDVRRFYPVSTIRKRP